MSNVYITADGKQKKVIGAYAGIDNKIVRITSGFFGMDDTIKECYQFRNMKTDNLLAVSKIIQCSTDSIKDNELNGSGLYKTTINDDYSITLESSIDGLSTLKQTNYIGLEYTRDDYNYKALFIEYRIESLNIENIDKYNDIRFRVFQIIDGKPLIENIPVEDDTKSLFSRKYYKLPSENIIIEKIPIISVDDNLKIIFGIDMNSSTNSNFKITAMNIYAQER